MAPTFVAAGSATTGATSGQTTNPLTMASLSGGLTPAAGDLLLIVAVAERALQPTLSGLSSTINAGCIGTSTNISIAVSWVRLAAGDLAGTITQSNSGPTARRQAIAAAVYRDAADPVFTQGAQTNAATTHPGIAATPAVDNSMLVAIDMSVNPTSPFTGRTYTPAGGWTQRVQVSSVNTTSQNANALIAEKLLGAGTAGNSQTGLTVTVSSASSESYWEVTVVLAPAIVHVTPKTVATSWAVRSSTTPKTSATSWATRAAVTPKTSATAWATRVAIAKTSATSWAVRAAILKTSATSWNTRVAIAKTSATSWAVRHTVTPKTVATSWAVRLTAIKTSATSWAVRSQAIKTSATSWAVRHTVTPKTSATAWAVRVAVTKTSSTSWNVGSTIVAVTPKTIATSWAVRTAVAPKTSTTTWAVRHTVTAKTSATTWAVRSSTAPKTIATSWAVRHTVTPKTSATSWAVRHSALKTSPTSWAVRIPAVKTSSTSWAVRSQAIVTVSTTWAVRVRVTPKASATTWSVRTIVAAKTSATSWNVRQAVTRTLVTTWRVNSEQVYPSVLELTALLRESPFSAELNSRPYSVPGPLRQWKGSL